MATTLESTMENSDSVSKFATAVWGVRACAILIMKIWKKHVYVVTSQVWNMGFYYENVMKGDEGQVFHWTPAISSDSFLEGRSVYPSSLPLKDLVNLDVKGEDPGCWRFVSACLFTVCLLLPSFRETDKIKYDGNLLLLCDYNSSLPSH